MSQTFKQRLRVQTDAVLAQFMRVLPSNYTSTAPGPSYILQFQALAEQVAAIQLIADEVRNDSDFGYTRPDFLWQIVGSLVFPDAENPPTIESDVEHREFLRRMVALLLQGSKVTTMEEGIKALSDVDVTIVERYIEAMKPGSTYTIDDQFYTDIFIEGFPVDPSSLSDNVKMVLRALKPAHVLYGYTYLFREAFAHVFDESDPSWELSSYYYEDFRKYCGGIKAITGTQGTTLSGRTLFTDLTRSFASVRVGAVLMITAGDNAGPYRVREVIRIPYPADDRVRAYTTSPTGLSGSGTITGGILNDPTQDFSSAVEGEVVTFTTGPNAGSYRIEKLLGAGGGIPGLADGPASRVRLDYCLLRIEGRMPVVLSGQSYTVDVDRLGVKVPRRITGEDVSSQFIR